MKTVDAIIDILQREKVEFLSCFPTTSVIDAAASVGMRPVICRQERVGVGIADGFARVTNGRRPAVFAMQYGPGAENAFAGVATAYSDSTPMLLIPLGQASAIAGVPPIFSSQESYNAVTKWVERLDHPHRLPEVMRRAFSRIRHGKPGPVMVEVAADILDVDIGDVCDDYSAVAATRSAADPRDVLAAARALVEAERPVIFAGQGVLYAEATDELVALAEMLQIPVVTTMLGKSAFPEDHPLSGGTVATVMSPLGYRAMADADVVLAVGASLTRHPMSITVPQGKTVIHATNDEADLNKSYPAAYPILGDAKLTLAQLAEAVAEVRGTSAARDNNVAAELAEVRDAWMAEWSPVLTSGETPINPYRVIHEMQRAIPPSEAIVTHDSGSPRDQMLPFYLAPVPRSYLGWGKSHGLGTGLGLTIGAKLAEPGKVCINVMGDAAFGMTGLDVETAVRAEAPIITVVFNNGTMAIENRNMISSHERYKARDLGGQYADIGRALGAYAERVTDPDDVGPAFQRARRVTEEQGQAVLLEFITSAETRFSHRRAL
ncbi:MAG: thiamine pyrophosphate-requiring protein [Chloroflexi bacterium]|nr:thiamine pyrophosphate-requiring protein [Chloroflexota bacterium]